MTRPFVIPKRLVWEAYQRVKANGGRAGVDQETIETFESKLGDKAEDSGIVGSNMPYVRSYIVRSSRINASMTTSVGLNIELADKFFRRFY